MPRDKYYEASRARRRRETISSKCNPYRSKLGGMAAAEVDADLENLRTLATRATWQRRNVAPPDQSMLPSKVDTLMFELPTEKISSQQ